MTSRPILFSAPMVRALLDGSKTQTRRVVKLQPKNGAALKTGVYTAINQREKERFANHDKLLLLTSTPDGKLRQPCPYGQVGDQLWVRETFLIENDYQPHESVIYRADGMVSVCSMGGASIPWKPSIFMPRWASRITIEITGVRVERLQDITEDDAKAEGATEFIRDGFVKATKGKVWSEAVRLDPAAGPFKGAYACLWESINGAGTWDLNPWVWVIEFKKVTL